MTTPTPPTQRPRGRPLMWLGLGLALAGIAAYLVQLYAQWLAFPWYMPASACLGVALIVASLWQRRTAWRFVALVVLVLLTGFEALSLYALRLPPYTGPIAVGKPFPPFQARLADGRPFAQEDLPGDRNTALVFFRGRW